jgi:lysozyme
MKKGSWGFMIVSVLALLLTQLGPATPSVWAAPSGHPLVHVVQRGENLTWIAWRYGTTVQAVAAVNHIANPNRIYPGQRLVIPDAAGTRSGGFWYTVRYGDTLSGLAWRHGRSVWSIANANGIGNPNRIYAGQRIYIP